MIDLHSHTLESDGTNSPAELIGMARQAGIRTLAITDHDTFSGYDQALPLAANEEIELICGVELSCRYGEKTVHLLAYFPATGAPEPFRGWVNDILHSRRERNTRLIDRLRENGIAITLEDVERYGRTVTGRPHFARVLVEKGHATDLQDAFRRFIGEEGSAFVERLGPSLRDAIEQVKANGGVSSLAHPVRIGLAHSPESELRLIAELQEAGLDALECYHSDHLSFHVDRYREFAALLGLLETGGSDFHGANKPNIRLGSVPVPPSVVAGLQSVLRDRSS